MVFLFDKQKVSVRFLASTRADQLQEVESIATRAGEVVYGRLEVSAAASLTLTNIRVDVECDEEIHVVKGSGKDRRDYRKSVKLLRHRIICFGFDGEKGRVELAQGSHSYPFTFQIPVIAPPSAAISSRDCSLKVLYKMEVVVDIPNGLDRTIKIPMVVYPTVCAQQMIDSARNTAAADQYETVPLASCSFCGCFCCEKDDELVDVSVRIVPSVSLLTSDTMYYGTVMGRLADLNGGSLIPADVQHLFPNGLAPFTFGIVVTVRNRTSSTEVKGFKATLTQYVEGRLFEKGTDASSVCSEGSSGNYVGPGEEGQFVIQMDLRKAYEKGKLQPAIETEYATLKQYISVEAVGTTIALGRTFPFLWAATVDETNCCPMLPATYGAEIVVPTNNYLASGAGGAAAPPGGHEYY